MAQQLVAVTYHLVLPEGTPRPKLESSTSHTRPVAPSTSDYKEYYDALQTAIDEIKAVTGHELTVWRDAVGNRELGKEANAKKRRMRMVAKMGREKSRLRPQVWAELKTLKPSPTSSPHLHSPHHFFLVFTLRFPGAGLCWCMVS
ncbi:hypothetical protein BJV74DRAFT_429326 [Russula compacta]|nr:hypothetical protein BJV74DRAFT_429326 [Russula compacta]